MTPTRETLLALADRVEALTAPDREVDAEIMCAVFGYERDGTMFYGKSRDYVLERDYYALEGSPQELPSPTASLDAAMTLVPEGRGWLAGYGRIRPDEPLGGAMITRIAAPTSFAPDAADKIAEAEAATPALALTAASLRARATLTDHPVTSDPPPALDGGSDG